MSFNDTGTTWVGRVLRHVPRGLVQRAAGLEHVVDGGHGGRQVRGGLQAAPRARLHQRARNENRHRLGVRGLDPVQPASVLALRGPVDAVR